MKTSPNVNEIQSAMIALQSELSPVSRDATGYGYRYATLDMVISHIQPLLEKHGLGFVQLACTADPGYVGLTTRIIHSSGEWLEEAAQWPVVENSKQSATQNAGAAFTYARRYGLLSALGIAAEDDNDAAPQRTATKTEYVRVRWNKEFLNRIRSVIPYFAEVPDTGLVGIAYEAEIDPPRTEKEMMEAKEKFEKYAAEQEQLASGT